MTAGIVANLYGRDAASTQRRYSYAEIQALRQVCEHIWLFGDSPRLSAHSCGRSYMQQDKDHGVEQLVQTYMVAGITASDIHKEQARRAKAMRKAMLPEQMKMARRFVSRHAEKISRKGLWGVYRGYRRCYYGYEATPSLNKDGDVNGSGSGCPDYVRFDQMLKPANEEVIFVDGGRPVEASAAASSAAKDAPAQKDVSSAQSIIGGIFLAAALVMFLAFIVTVVIAN